MNRKEISEIRKQLTPDRCAISRIAFCYVDGEKNKVSSTTSSFLTLPEEEQSKYFAIFRKVLSNSLGRNELNMDFSPDEEAEGTPYSSLYELYRNGPDSRDLLDAYYDKVIKAYDTAENFLILTIFANYDIPGKGKDNEEMFDASDEVFRYMICAVCPVALAKPALAWDAESGVFRNRIRDRIVKAPEFGFMFPSFNDRATDIHSLLFYSKKADELPTDFIDTVLGCDLPMTAGAQRETFTELVQETLGDDCDFETVKNIHEQLHDIREKAKDSPDPVILKEDDIRNILAQSGASNDHLENFGRHYEHAAGENTEFTADNISDDRKLEVHTPDVKICISPDRPDLIRQQDIEGRPCLVIPITDEVSVNGIRLNRF